MTTPRQDRNLHSSPPGAYFDAANSAYYGEVMNAYISGGVFYGLMPGKAIATRLNVTTGARVFLGATVLNSGDVIAWTELPAQAAVIDSLALSGIPTAPTALFGVSTT